MQNISTFPLVSFSVCFFAFFVFLVSVSSSNSWNFVYFNLLYKTITLSSFNLLYRNMNMKIRAKAQFFNQFMSPVSCHMKRTKANQNFLVFLRDKYNFCDTYLIIPSQIEGIGLGPLGPFLIYCPSIELDPFTLSLSPHLLGQMQLIWWPYW